MQLPEDIYRRLEQCAQVANKPMEEIVVQSVRAGMPPSVNDLPPEFRKECLVLERLSDKQLRRVPESTMPARRQRKYTHLLRKNQAGALTKQEQQQLKRFGSEARRLTLEKAYAYALLKRLAIAFLRRQKSGGPDETQAHFDLSPRACFKNKQDSVAAIAGLHKRFPELASLTAPLPLSVALRQEGFPQPVALGVFDGRASALVAVAVDWI